MAPLIDLEKVFLFLSFVSSLRLTRLVTAKWMVRASGVGAQAAEITAESETSAKSLERRGCVIANLKCTDAQVAASVLYFCSSVAACAAWCDRNAAVQSSVLNF
jgi:hypothetical protein